MKLINIIKTSFVALLLTASAAKADVIVTFNPSTTDVTVGDTFTVDVLANASELSDAILFFDIGFTLDADSITLGSDFAAAGGTFFDVAGFVDSFPNPPLPISGSDILLATLTFTASSTGDLVLDLTNGIFGGGFAPLVFQSTALNLTVNDVSAPATLGLLSLALVGLVSLRRKA